MMKHNDVTDAPYRGKQKTKQFTAIFKYLVPRDEWKFTIFPIPKYVLLRTIFFFFLI